MFNLLNGIVFNTEKFGECWFEMAKYNNNRTAIQILSSDGPVSVLTINLPEIPLNERELFIKTWGGNELILQDVLKTGLFVDTGKSAATGFVKASIWTWSTL